MNAIRTTDPNSLVSVGAWKAIANTDSFGFHDLYKDECLVAAGGEAGVSVFMVLNDRNNKKLVNEIKKNAVYCYGHGDFV